jgi:hypothetical protein
LRQATAVLKAVPVLQAVPEQALGSLCFLSLTFFIAGLDSRLVRADLLVDSVVGAIASRQSRRKRSHT